MELQSCIRGGAEGEKVMTYIDFMWEHFKFNAEQRLKAFNYFVLLSIFANGGVISGLNTGVRPLIMIVLGGLLCILSIVFWIADNRSKALLALSIEALRTIESEFPPVCQIFRLDLERQGRAIRYSTAITVLLFTQFLFGIGVVAYGSCQLLASFS